MSLKLKNEIATLSFFSPKDFEKWMRNNHATAPGLWLRIFKKNSGQESITYAEALDVALCYGWIDSQRKSYDTASYLQKFTPRRAKSLWSKVNQEHIERLTKERRMQPSGIIQVEMAKEDGRWKEAYESSRTAKVPEDFLFRLKKDKKAYVFFNTLTKSNMYSIIWRLQTAKNPEMREKRIQKILEMLQKGQTFH